MDSETRAQILADLRSRRAARKHTNEGIQAARSKLAHGRMLKPEFEFELLSMFARNELGATVTILALSAILSLASMFWAPWAEGCAWLVLVIGTKVVLLELCRRMLASDRAHLDVAIWKRRLVMSELLCGVSWAGFALVGINSPEQMQVADYSSHVFIFAALIVLLAVRMTFASTVLPVLYAGTIPMTLAVAGRLIALNEPFYYALATMAVAVHVYFVFMAMNLHETAVQMLAFRSEKDTLIAELDEEKIISEEARHRAEAASKAKSRFLATMSHELRTPLNAIMGFSEVMKDEMFGKHATPVYREYSNDIYDSGRHLLELINEILDLSRIEVGRYELHEEKAHLGDIAQDCHRLLRVRAKAKGLEIEEDIDPSLAQVWVDQRAVRQMCLNLMSNALKFTPNGGRITITVAALENGGQVLAVRDTGPGIPPDEIPKVMQAFGQGSLAHETAEGGTGLGLTIVKSLIELHGGSFNLSSELRKGTVASITVPSTRVLATVRPLQPLGEERHRQQVSARPARLKASIRAVGSETTARSIGGRP